MYDIPASVMERLLRRLGSGLAWAGYLFLILPSLVVIPISFGDQNEIMFPPRRWSFYLYEQFFSSPDWVSAALQSFTVAFAATLVAVLVGTPAAYALARGNFPGRDVLNLLLLSPILVPVVVLGLGFYLYFSRLELAGTTISLILAHAVLVTPFVVVSASGALRHANPALETTAMIMGAGQTVIFFRVVSPQISSAIVVGSLFSFLISFDEVVVAYFISGSQTTTLPVRMYSAIQWEISPVIAAVSTMLTLLSFVICLSIMGLQKKKHQPSRAV